MRSRRRRSLRCPSGGSWCCGTPTEWKAAASQEVAPLLGLAPNAVAALAYRAREGLRQAYLPAHLRDQNAADCHECATNLGAYVHDGLSARDRRRVDAHLDGCASCKGLVAETCRHEQHPARCPRPRSSVSPRLPISAGSAATVCSPRSHASEAAAGGGGWRRRRAALVLLALVAGALGGGDDPAPSAAETVVVDSSGPGRHRPQQHLAAGHRAASAAGRRRGTSHHRAGHRRSHAHHRAADRHRATARPTGSTRPPVTVPVTTVPGTALPATTLPATTTTQPPPPTLHVVAVQEPRRSPMAR